MRVFNRTWRHLKGMNRSGMVRLTGSVVVGSSGAVSSSDTPGFQVRQINGATGRYRVHLMEEDGVTYAAPTMVYYGTSVTTPFGFQDISVAVVSAQASSALTSNSAITWAIRNYRPQDGYFEIQFYKSLTSGSDETHTDTNVESGGTILLGFSVKTSSVVP
jgi:hypothetical protein